MTEKRHLTIASDTSVEDILARVAEGNKPNPENELRLAKLDAKHKIDHSSLTMEQVQMIHEFTDTLIAQNNPVESPEHVENEHTRAALKDASDRLVEGAIQSPWQRQRESFLRQQEEELGDA